MAQQAPSPSPGTAPVYPGGPPLPGAQALYADIKGRAERAGRDPEHIKILPGAFVVVGDSVDEAKEKTLVNAGASAELIAALKSGMYSLSADKTAAVLEQMAAADERANLSFLIEGIADNQFFNALYYFI